MYKFFDEFEPDSFHKAKDKGREDAEVKDLLMLATKFAKQFGLTDEDADDVAVEAVMALLKNSAQATFSHSGQIFAYLRNCVRSSTIDIHRKEKRQFPAAELLVPSFEDTSRNALKTLVELDKRQAFMDLLAKLEPKYRMVVVLHLEGYSWVEIGKLLDLTTQTARQYYYRALDKLKKATISDDSGDLMPPPI